MTNPILRSAIPWLLLALGGCASLDSGEMTTKVTGPRVHYLEIVTPEVDATCAIYAQLYGVTFGEPEPRLGNARTAALANGGMIGVRSPMHEAEEPVVRAYLVVEDIEVAANVAAEAGGKIAYPPTEIPGYGKFAIYIQGGIDHALWQH